MTSTLNLGEMCSGIAEDMYLLQGLAKSSSQMGSGQMRVDSITSLTKLIKFKNSRYSYSDDQR